VFHPLPSLNVNSGARPWDSISETGRDSHRRRERKVPKRMIALQNLLQWLTHNPLGAATVLYITGVISVLVYAYFEPQDQA